MTWSSISLKHSLGLLQAQEESFHDWIHSIDIPHVTLSGWVSWWPMDVSPFLNPESGGCGIHFALHQHSKHGYHSPGTSLLSAYSVLRIKTKMLAILEFPFQWALLVSSPGFPGTKITT
jgi:hypothetical protein